MGIKSEITAIGIDLGGTRIKGVVVDHTGQLLHQLYLPTHDGDGAVWKQTVAEMVAALQQKSPAAVVGISAPGLPASDNLSIASMPGRMQGLENFIWSTFLGRPAYVLNDAVAALMAEARLGVAKNKKQVVMVTLGTGVGGAILIDGHPYQGAFSKAGHIGHMVIDEAGDPDVTGMPGSLEVCTGNCTIEKRSGGRFQSTQQLLNAVHQGDEMARELWLRSVRHLALGLATVTNILSPELIVLGGGITEAGTALFDPLENYMEAYEWRAGGNKVQIAKAMYGDLAGAAGAACFAMEKNDEPYTNIPG